MMKSSCSTYGAISGGSLVRPRLEIFSVPLLSPTMRYTIRIARFFKNKGVTFIASIRSGFTLAAMRAAICWGVTCMVSWLCTDLQSSSRV